MTSAPSENRKRPSLAILGSRGIPARYGGFETFAEQLSTRLVRAGFPVTVFGERHAGEPARGEHQGVRLERVAVPRLGSVSALVYDVLCLWRARREHDVVFMLGYGAGPFCALPRLAGREVWISMDGLEWQRGKWGWLARTWLRRMERAALRAGQRIVFDSEAVRRAVLGERADARVSVIAYGAELDLEHDPLVLESLALRPKSYYLVVCRIEPENHVLEVVRAVSRGPTTRALLVVGDLERAGAYGEACRRAAGPQVRFLGPVFDRPTLHALRVESWAVIHGHSVGGTNPSLLEALAAGAPVLAHDNPYNREVVGEGALWFRDEETLVGALSECERRTAEERVSLGERGRRTIQERFTWERVTEAYARLLDPSFPGARVEPPAATAGEPPGPLPARREGARAGERAG